jgi:hypothetical protein
MFNSPRANLGAALARLQQANPSPEANAVMAYVWAATALAMVEERSVASKSAASTSSRHSRMSRQAST